MGDPFGGMDAGPSMGYGVPVSTGTPGFGTGMPGMPGFPPGVPPAQPKLNTYAVLSPIFGVLLPPAGIVLGHLALPQIKRTGERGRPSAIAGLVIGYLLTVALIILLILSSIFGWLFFASDDGPTQPLATTATTSKAGVTVAPSTKTVTATTKAPARRRDKIELSQATVGMCVEIQSRDTGAYALDLFEVDCESMSGVYTVVSIASSGSACNTTYAAEPPDRSFAVCLNKY